jgi:ribosomal protein S18 acetylase RimI-like enzyme
VLRHATAQDEGFLWEMLGHASAPDGPPNSPEHLRSVPELARYVDGWGRAGDVGLVAVDDESGEALGAGWYRTFTAAEPGYGFVDEATPEIAIACTAAGRGRGLGHELIDGLLAVAHEAGLARLSLSVRLTNVPAVRVYEDCGFVGVQLEEDGLHLTMAAPTRPVARAGERVAVEAVEPGGLPAALVERSAWGDAIASRGVLHRVADHPSFVARIGEEAAGLLSWRIEAAGEVPEIEVLGVESWVPGRGVGAALLRAVRAEARARGVRRLWLIANDDNTDALRWYQRRGWQLVAVHRGGVALARQLKPTIPLVGAHGIVARHEVELELVLDG